MGGVGGVLAVVGSVAVIGVVVVHGGALGGFFRLFGGAALGLFGLAVGLVKQG